MSIRRFVFKPSDYDPDYYESEYPSPDYDDDDRWETYIEECITDVDNAYDTAKELYWTVTDDDTGERPAFMEIDIDRQEMYPYGGFPRGGVVVTVDIMDDPREIEAAWAERQGEDWWNTDRDSTPRHRRQALSRYNREMAKAEKMFDGLVDAGFDEKADTGRIGATDAWGVDPHHTTEVPSPYDWPSRSQKASRSGKSAGKTKKSAPASKSQKRDSKGRFVKDSKAPNIKTLSPKSGSRGSKNNPKSKTRKNKATKGR